MGLWEQSTLGTSLYERTLSVGLETLIGIGKFDTIVLLITFEHADASGLLSSSRKANLLLHVITCNSSNYIFTDLPFTRR